MDTAVASIIVALIGTVGTVVVTIIQKFRKENRLDHNTVMNILQDLHGDVEDLNSGVQAVNNKIDNHIIWHLNDKK